MQIISREQLSNLLNAIAARETLVAPTRVDGVLLYRPVETPDCIDWEFTRPVMSIKDAFFPQTERLMTFEQTGTAITIHEEPLPGPKVIFGVRPCDARGMLALDAVFINTPPVDTSYKHRRDNTTLIGLACKEMWESCFCTSVGGAPNSTEGMDLMLTEVDGGYAVEVITDRGRALLGNTRLDSVPGDPPSPVLKETLSLPPQESWPEQFEAPFWAEITERCLNCRACAYVCPTCRCFDVRDEPLPAPIGQKRYERIRSWDSCAGEAYRREASGHNPREVKRDRLRNRFMCKFYYYAEQYGPVACTGCGRCIDACPVNIDITEVLAAALAALEEVQP